jgi:hypothetical protein
VLNVFTSFLDEAFTNKKTRIGYHIKVLIFSNENKPVKTE